MTRDMAPYRVEQLEDPQRGHAVHGPALALGWWGTVPQSHHGMLRLDAQHLKTLLDAAYHAGLSDARRDMRLALGMKP